jgi:tetratricopeptide (TPR) repeat protein
MSPDKLKESSDKNKPAPAKATPPPKGAVAAKAPVTPVAPPAKVPPLYRRVDWLTFAVTTLLVFIGYYLTVAPDVTMEDSGELTAGSFYAAVPHPPGYPMWSIMTYIFGNIFRVGNFAYRVAVCSALCGALASGFLAMLVSRAGSMMVDSIPDFKDLNRNLENAIVFVAGMASGLMLAFNGYMWSQCVIVEVYPASVVSLMVACVLLLRWIYAPHQRLYIYLAWFVFGLGFTNHQTLLVATMGLEIAIVATSPRFGRDFLLWNSLIYVLGAIAILSGNVMSQFDPGFMVQAIFHIVGIGSLIGLGFLSFGLFSGSTKKDKFFDNVGIPVISLVAWAVAGLLIFLMNATVLGVLVILATFGFWIYKTAKKSDTLVMQAFLALGLWVAGAAVFFYMPITSMTNPPMNWGYPRTWDGFIHAFTRGQYEKITPTNFFSDPARMLMQLKLYVQWAYEEFNILNLCLAVIPIIFFFRLQKRERSWLMGLAGIWFCLAIILLILLNPSTDRAAQSLNKVFFASSYTGIAMYIGYGLILVAASMATQFQRFRIWAICGGIVAVTLALVNLYGIVQNYENGVEFGSSDTFFGAIKQSFAANQYGLPIHAGLILLGLAVTFTIINLVCRQKVPMSITLAIFALLPLHSIMSHWADNEERNHWFGYWFGHDMFTPPFGVYPEMTRNAVLFGGTDPGRFCPTYMIFVESMIPHDKQPAEDQKFDRRDVYIITQNALADPTYLEYIRAQYNRSTQTDTPFFQEMLRSTKEKEQNYYTNFVARTADTLLDKPLTAWGKRVEDRRRADLIYPPKEIYCPTAEDSSKAFADYMQDAQQRLMHDMQFPNEPRQIKPGEDVHPQEGGRVSVSGQVAVMSINGLLTKDIFDHNPDNEFFVEESFPLDWMYPYLSPFGVIMKINRQPVDTITDDMIKKDHDFWSKYSDRLIGNWITYDTPLKDIAAFVKKVYQQRNFTGFTGDQKFVRDDVAQKSFSKLRSSIGGIYDYRTKHSKTQEEYQKMMREADFAYKQSFAFCPYSPEAVFRYVQLLIGTGRLDDALVVADTCLTLDPNNGSVEVLDKQLHDLKNRPQQAGQTIGDLEHAYAADTNNFQAAFTLANAYIQTRQPERGFQVMDSVMNNPKADASVIMSLAQAYNQFKLYPRLEIALEKLTVLEPHSPEAWCDLSAMKAMVHKTSDALTDLSRAIDENKKRLASNPKASDIVPAILKDPRFDPLRNMPEYQQIMAGQK